MRFVSDCGKKRYLWSVVVNHRVEFASKCSIYNDFYCAAGTGNSGLGKCDGKKIAKSDELYE